MQCLIIKQCIYVTREVFDYLRQCLNVTIEVFDYKAALNVTKGGV